MVWLLLLVGTQAVHSQVHVPSGTPTPAPGTSVNVGVPDTALVISGCASPHAFVQIFNDNTPVATTTANSQGRFVKRIGVNNDDAGLHTIKLYYQDINNRTSSVISQSINLSSQADTNLDLLLPSTIEHEPEPVRAGDYLIFRGSTCPGALVNLNIDNNLTLAAKADSKGNWYVIANTDNYYKGGHVYDALSSKAGKISQKTQKYQFNVTGEGQAPGEPPAELTPPQITEPDDLFLSSSDTVTVRGTGPLNSQIELFMGDSLIGSVFTNPNGEWSFTLKLNNNLTTITARSCYKNSCGDFGNSVRIRYSGDLVTCNLNFALADYRFYGLDANSGLDLRVVSLEGANSVSTLIDWGDSNIEHLTLESNSLSPFHHVYSSHGQYNGSISMTDQNGCQSLRYFSVLVAPTNPPNWWMLGAIPLAGITIYFLSQFINAYQNQRRWSLYRPDPHQPPAGWPTSRPWPKPAYGDENDDDKPDIKK